MEPRELLDYLLKNPTDPNRIRSVLIELLKFLAESGFPAGKPEGGDEPSELAKKVGLLEKKVASLEKRVGKLDRQLTRLLKAISEG